MIQLMNYWVGTTFLLKKCMILMFLMNALPTDQQTYIPVEMQFYISVTFLGLPDDINEEKPSFKINALPTNRPTDGRTDGPTDGRTDGRTDGPTDGHTFL